MRCSKEVLGTQGNVMGLEIQLTWCQPPLFHIADAGLSQATELSLSLGFLLVRWDTDPTLL